MGKFSVFSDVGNHSLNIWDPSTDEYSTLSGNGKGTRDGKSGQFVQPTGVFAERKTGFVGDSSTGCLRMISEGTPLVKYLTNLHKFAETFGLHQMPQLHLTSTQQSPESRRCTSLTGSA